MLSTICSLTLEFERSLWSQVSASGKTQSDHHQQERHDYPANHLTLRQHCANEG